MRHISVDRNESRISSALIDIRILFVEIEFGVLSVLINIQDISS